jgi:hypothetical protein
MKILDRVKGYVAVAAVVAGACALGSCSSGQSQTPPPPPPAVVVSIGNKIAVAGADATQTAKIFNATVTNDSNNAGVTWALKAGNPLSDCSPDCGTLSNQQPLQVSYTPPVTVPVAPNNTPTVIATSVTDTSKSDSDQFTIQSAPGNLSLLTGEYVFQMTGFDSAGHPMAAEGSFTGKGDGTLANVSLDLNDNASATSSSGPSLTGTYTLDESFLGVISLDSTISGVPQNPKFAFSLTSDGTFGHIISFDANGYAMTGFFLQVDPTIFSLAGIADDVTFTFHSNLPVRTAVVGRLTLDSSGNITNGLLDSSTAGVGPTLASSAVTGTVSALDATSGRATVTLTVNGQTLHFALYATSRGNTFLLQTDAVGGTLLAGSTSFQSLNKITAASVNGTSLFLLEGFDTGAKPGPIAVTGNLFVANGNSATFLWDSNDAGTIASLQTANGQTVTFDPTTGRGTITVTGGHANGFFDSAVFYLAFDGRSFVVDTTAGANNRGLVGRVEGVSPGSVTISGNMLLREGGPVNGATDAVSTTAPSIEGMVNASNGAFTGAMDGRTVGQPDFTGAPFSGTFQPTDPNTGRGTAMLPGALFGQANPVPCVYYTFDPAVAGFISTAPGVPSGVVGLQGW